MATVGAGTVAISLTTLGVVAITAALTLAALALFRDRARGRRRCPRCWYDMTAIPGLRCPECGKLASSDRALTRTRRRWLIASAAFLLCLGGLSLITSAARVQRSGWIGMVPTTALVWWVADHEPQQLFVANAFSKPTAWAQELNTRFKANEPWQWQWEWLMTRLSAVRARPRWPKDRPVLVSTGVPPWLNFAQCKFDSTRPGHGHVMNDHIFAWDAGSLPAPGEPPIAITLTAGRYSMLWPLNVQPVERAQDALTPATDPQLDELVRASLLIFLRSEKKRDDVPWDALLAARFSRGPGAIPNDLAIGLSVQFLHNGVVVDTQSLCPLDSPYAGPSDWLRMKNPGPPATAPADAFTTWTVRITGDADVALKDMKRNRYWAGEFTLPLRDFLR